MSEACLECVCMRCGVCVCMEFVGGVCVVCVCMEFVGGVCVVCVCEVCDITHCFDAQNCYNFD